MTEPKTQLAISTFWASKEAPSAVHLLEKMERSGLSRLELEYRITTPLMNQLRQEMGPAGFTVCSLHNYCPIPPDLPPERASGDLFNLASLDQQERLLAVEYTTRTMELASDLEASAVVLHLGWIDELTDREIIFQAAGRADLEQPHGPLTAFMDACKEKAPRHVDAVSFSLERLLDPAQRLGVRLGLENRFHPFQIPSLPELKLLLDRFEGAPMGHWHDTGHSAVAEKAGLEPAAQWLKSFEGKILGCHLHDLEGVRDHISPGAGELDWEFLTQALNNVPIRVLELRPETEPEQIRDSVQMLTELFDQAKEKQSETG